MHELAIAESLLHVVAARAGDCHAARVNVVHLRVGEATGVVPDSLAFCFELLTQADPILRGARLVVDEVPHRAWCERCRSAFAVHGFVASCPVCGDWSEAVLSGTELQVVDMEINTQDEAG